MPSVASERVETLVRSMSLPEKLGQLSMAAAGSAVTGPIGGADALALIRSARVGSLLNLIEPAEIERAQRVAREETRLGIPLLLGFDIIHGHRTIFPIPLAEVSAFDPALWERTARAAAAEAAEDGIALTFSPMLDVARDPRWGRIAEGPGEDPMVASRFAVAKVRGYQGAGLGSPGTIAATAKHFCAYGAAVAGLDYLSADISDRTLHEVYLPPFAAAVGAGVAAIMPAFNDVAGVPMSANRALLTGYLRDTLGFEGVLVSDYNAIAELIRHGVAADLAEAAALALAAGVDIDMMAGAYEKGLPVALERGLVGPDLIDAAVRRVLTLKERLGLFDPAPRTVPSRREERRALARSAGRRSIVLLSNRNDVLPLAGRNWIAVIGPLADDGPEMRGSWAGAGHKEPVVSILDGLGAALPGVRLLHETGVAVKGGGLDGIDKAVQAARAADLVVLCVGESSVMSGEAASRADLGLPGHQRELCEAILSVGRPVVVLLTSGRPLTVPWLVERADAVVATWQLGSEAGNAIADVLTGRVDASGRSPVTWPRSVGQIPIYFGRRAGGRPGSETDTFTSRYLDSTTEPLFAFGHGLSYTRFQHRDLSVERPGGDMADRLDVRLTVDNVGEREGETTMFLFARPESAVIAPPALALAGVAKAVIPPGERRTLHFVVPVRLLAPPALPGETPDVPRRVRLFAGPSADPGGLLHHDVTLRTA